MLQETRGRSYNPILDILRGSLAPTRSPIGYGSTPFATVTQAYIRSVLNGISQAIYTPPPSDYEKAVRSGQSTYNWGRSTTREAAHIHRNWTKALEETIRHVCETANRAGDKGRGKATTIGQADFRKIEEAAKYGLTVDEKAKIDGMSLGKLTQTYSFLQNVSPYQGYSATNAKERNYILSRYRKLLDESVPKPPSIKDNPLYSYYSQMISSGINPHTGEKATDLELAQAKFGQASLLAGPFVDAFTMGYGYTYREPGGSSIKKNQTGTNKVYGPQQAKGSLKTLKPYGPEQYSGSLQPLQDTLSETTRVGRWMSPEEYSKMIETGKVQMSPNGNRTFVSNPADIEAFQSSAKGSVYIEFDVDKNYIFQAGQENWGQIPGPGSKFDKLLEKRGVPILDGMPDAYNIKKTGEK